MVNTNKHIMTNTIQNLDRTAVRMINAEIEAALQQVSEKYGIQIDLGNSSFTNTNCELKVKYAVKGGDGMVMTREAEDYNRYARMKGFTKKLGDLITMGGNTYEIVGMKPRSTKYPILAKCTITGKTYKFSEVYV